MQWPLCGAWPPRRPAHRAQDWVMEPGRANLRADAAACRAACAEDARCTAWLWCARPGGCDDGQVWSSGRAPCGYLVHPSTRSQPVGKH